MKKTAIILTALALIAGSCGQATKKQTAENNIATEDLPQIRMLHNSYKLPATLIIEANDTYISTIRPNEKLQLGNCYTDTFAFVAYNNLDNDFVCWGCKDGKYIPFIANKLKGKKNEWLPDGIYQIKWKIDTIHSTDDKELLYVEYFAEKITIIKIPDWKIVSSMEDGLLKEMNQN